MEELASTCRNIFELLLTVKYYGALEEDAEVYLSQTEVDRNLVHEGILEWLRATNPESPGVLALSHIETTKDKGLKPPPRPNAKQMAQQANMVVEYDGFYKFYSKYIHPSAWSVNSRPEQLEHEGYREMLVFQCITYGTQTATLLGALRNLGSSAQTVLESPDPLNAKNQTDGKARGCSS
jgi:hypothetical protein